MNKIIITTDSGIDPIDVDRMVPGQLCRDDGKSYRDVIEITPEEVLRQTKEEHHLFKTSSPLYTDYEEIFKKALDDGEEVIHLSMGSGISQGSVNQARNVANDVCPERITVFDTLTGATGGTLIDEYTKHLVEEGLSKKEIIDKLTTFRKYSKTSFFVPNPVGFKRSGRDKSEMCLKEKAIVIGAQALKLAGVKFRVDFNEEGCLYTKKTMIGNTRVKSLQMIKEIINDDTVENIDNRIAIIGNVMEEIAPMSEIEDYLNKYFTSVIRQNINGVVAAYGSADLVGISYVKKR